MVRMMIQFSTLPGLSICTQFIGSLRCTLSVPNGPVCRNKLVLLYRCSILLTQSYAPEPNPGPRPIQFPCAICHKAVKWTTPGVCCDSCDVWYHQEFMGMPDCAYDGLKNVSWECFQCGVPNISTSIFDTTIFETSNSFSQLSDQATTPIGILGQVWYLIVSIPDLCTITYFQKSVSAIQSQPPRPQDNHPIKTHGNERISPYV